MAAAQRIYARALFDAAQERGVIGPVRDDFRAFVEATHEVPELRAVLRNPELDRAAKVQLLEPILAGVEELVRNFVLVTLEKGRAVELDEISREFEALVAAQERLLTVELTTAYELSDEETAAIVAQIEKAAGRTVEATRSVDPDLVGGLVLHAGSLRVDASVRGRLERLRQELVSRA
jgi:F-type H+-transporting ATPase subunit delta